MDQNKLSVYAQSKQETCIANDKIPKPCDGELWYRGYNIYTLIRSISKEAYGFEKIAYLLLFGEYPDSQEEEGFFEILGEARELPQVRISIPQSRLPCLP